MTSHSPLRLTIDSAALVANWRTLDALSGGAECGAAVKANAYGIGALETVRHLRRAGCGTFLVATWAEAGELIPLLDGASLSVLHGLAGEDMEQAAGSPARPVLNTAAQVRRWREIAGDRPCDVMVDTGINRLGLTLEEVTGGLLAGLQVDTLMSHLACADEDVPQNAAQRERLLAAAEHIPHRRLSLANSAGIFLGQDYALGLTRPGLALYGGTPRSEASGRIRQVMRAEAQVVQRRRISAGDSVGYNATFTAPREMELAILNVGYADGYLRGFSSRGRAFAEGAELPVVGRVSMDLTAIAVDAAPQVGEGDWVELDYDLPSASTQSGLSQYELLTLLGSRYQRRWT